MGGDARFVRLCSLLREDGHGVFPLALEAELPELGPPDWHNADCVLLPLPAEREGFLNAPLSGARLRVEELLEPLRPGTRVLAGMAGEGLREYCRRRGLALGDYFLREELQVKNAAITAEGAVALLSGLDGGGLLGRRVLICGFGRIGRLLAPRLAAMGAGVSVAARSASDRAWASAMGFAAMEPGCAPWAGVWDFVVNTVPAVIFGGEELAALGKARLLELASPPGGFDAAALPPGVEVIRAPGLPARCAPLAAAEAIRDTIYNMLEV